MYLRTSHVQLLCRLVRVRVCVCCVIVNIENNGNVTNSCLQLLVQYVVCITLDYPDTAGSSSHVRINDVTNDKVHKNHSFLAAIYF